MSTQEEKRFKQWAAALAVHDSTRERKPEGYWELYQPAEAWRNVLTMEDKRVGAETMSQPDYNAAMIEAQSAVEQYFVRIGVY